MVLPDVQWQHLQSDLVLCSAFRYEGPIRKTIVDWKEQQHRAARIRVQQWFAAGLLPLLERRRDLLCVPIPSSPANDRLRGTSVLADVMKSLPIGIDTGLSSARPRRDQAGLSRVERIENLHNAFTWNSQTMRPMLIVDDVVTSGATMRAAAAAIRAGGGHVWGAFGLARRGIPTPVVSRPEGIR